MVGVQGFTTITAHHIRGLSVGHDEQKIRAFHGFFLNVGNINKRRVTALTDGIDNEINHDPCGDGVADDGKPLSGIPPNWASPA